MNYKQILTVVVGVAFVLSMVALYDPNYSNDDVTGAFSFREMFGRSDEINSHSRGRNRNKF